MDGSNASAHYGAPLPTGTRVSTYAAMFACAKAMPMRHVPRGDKRAGSWGLPVWLWLCRVWWARVNAYTHILKRVFAPYPRIRTPACVYAPPAYTHPCLRIRTYPRIRTLRCVYARTCVYAPTPAYKHVCVNAASGAYTHLPAYTHPTLRLRRDATNVMIYIYIKVPFYRTMTGHPLLHSNRLRKYVFM